MNVLGITPEQVQLFLFSLLRVSAVLITMPIVGNTIVPAQVKGGLALLMTITIFPFVQSDLTFVVYDFLPLLLRMVAEVFIGIVIGFTARFVFAGIQFAGDMIGFQMGFSIASVFDPLTSQQVSIVSEFQFMLVMIIFLFVDAHHIFLTAMVDSFRIVRLQDFQLSQDFFRGLVLLSGNVFVIAIKISAPIVAVLLFVNVGLGVIARTVPQINVFIIGIPLQIAVGLKLALANSTAPVAAQFAATASGTSLPQPRPKTYGDTTQARSALGRVTFRLCLFPSLLVLATVTILPTLYLLVTSLTPLDLTRPEATWDFSRPLSNYAELLRDRRFHNSVWVQTKISVATVGLQLLGGLAVALLLNMRSSLLRACRTLFLVPMVLPPIVVAIIWKVLYTPDISPILWALRSVGLPAPSPITEPHLALWAIVVADVWEWFPFTMLMILAALQMMPEEPLEAARIDGAGRWRTFLHVVLPLLRPALLVAGLFRLVDSIKAFPLIYVLTEGGPGTVTEVTNYYAFVQAFNFSYLGFSSAITVVMLSATLVLSWWIVRLVGARVEID